MVAHQKYATIELNTHLKEINYYISKFLELATEVFEIQEKIHGTNVQIHKDVEGKIWWLFNSNCPRKNMEVNSICKIVRN